MFNKYRFTWNDGNDRELLFYSNSKRTRGGVMHRAWVAGDIPRLDDCKSDWQEYKRNNGKLLGRMVYSIPSSKRALERYCGQNCLRKLWDRIDSLPFVDLGRACSWGNPFAWPDEPERTELEDPEELLETIRLARKMQKEENNKE